MAGDKVAGGRLFIAWATWRRRALGDEAADELEMLKGAAGERWWLVGTY